MLGDISYHKATLQSEGKHSFTFTFTKLLTNGFRNSFEIPEARYELSNFIMEFSVNQIVNFEKKNSRANFVR